MSEQSAKNPAPGVKGASDNEEEDELNKLVDAEIDAVECILHEFPNADETEIRSDFAYDVIVKGKYLGTVYVTSRYDNSVLTLEEICAQVQDIKNKFAQKGGKK